MFFAIPRKLKRIIGNAQRQNLEHFYLYGLKLNGIAVNLYVSKKRATKGTIIHCTESGDIIWEQLYPFGGMSRPAREKKHVLKPIYGKSSVTVIAICGTPGNIVGLDNGIFKSRFSSPEANFVYLMPEAYCPDFLVSL